MANGSMPPSDTESKSESEWGRQAPHARIVARPRPCPRPWPLSSRHLSHASISDLRSALSALLCSVLSLSALPWSALCLRCLHVDSLRRCSDTEVAEFAQAGPRSRSIFMANWRQLALNFSSSFVVYAFTYAPFLAPPPLPPLSPFLWHLARFLFKIHNCRRQRRVIVGEFATPCCLAASRLSPFPLCTATPSAPPRNRSRFYTCSSYVLRYAALT